MPNFWKTFWVFTLMVIALQLGFYYPELPDRMAVHFDFSGNPDNWSDKSTFVILMAAAIILCNIWLPISRWLFKVMPDSMINAPHKEYWLAKENRERFIEITNKMLAMVLSVINLILIYGLKYTYDINIKGSSELELWYIIFPTIFVIIVPVIYYLRKLKMPDNTAGRMN
jgi:uncharacterized membrane protein